MPEREREDHQVLIFIINGQDFPVRANFNAPLKVAAERALRESGNTARPADEWEVRDIKGVLLDTQRSPRQLGLHDRARLFLSLQVGAGGVDQSRSNS